MPLLFSYGTLQQDDVQLATVGRRLSGVPDALSGWERSTCGPHANVTFTGAANSRVEGTALEVTDGELARFDDFEAQFDYERIAVRLESGRDAWVYVHVRP